MQGNLCFRIDGFLYRVCLPDNLTVVYRNTFRLLGRGRGRRFEGGGTAWLHC